MIKRLAFDEHVRTENHLKNIPIQNHGHAISYYLNPFRMCKVTWCCPIYVVSRGTGPRGYKPFESFLSLAHQTNVVLPRCTGWVLSMIYIFLKQDEMAYYIWFSNSLWRFNWNVYSAIENLTTYMCVVFKRHQGSRAAIENLTTYKLVSSAL